MDLLSADVKIDAVGLPGRGNIRQCLVRECLGQVRKPEQQSRLSRPWATTCV